MLGIQWRNYIYYYLLNNEHKKVFSNVSVVRFRNGKSHKDYLVKAKLHRLEDSGICEPCGKKNFIGLKYYRNIYYRSTPRNF